MKKLTGLLAAFAMGGMLAAAPASAAVFTEDGSCDVMSITPGADACWGKLLEVPENDSEALLNSNEFVGDVEPDTAGVLGMFNQTDWQLADGTDEATQIDIGLNVTGVNATNGNWSFDAAAMSVYEQALVVLKAGNTFIAYLFDIPLSAASGTWDTTGLTGPKGQLQDLSHLNVYVRGDGPDANIPLPAAGFLLLGAMGGLGVAGWRRRRKAA